jgi:hypothetical protein
VPRAEKPAEFCLSSGFWPTLFSTMLNVTGVRIYGIGALSISADSRRSATVAMFFSLNIVGLIASAFPPKYFTCGKAPQFMERDGRNDCGDSRKYQSTNLQN